MAHLSPNAPIVARDLAVKVFSVNGFDDGGTVRFTLRADGTDTDVWCEMIIPAGATGATGPRSCDSGTATALIAPASELALSIIETGTARLNPPIVLFGWRATTP